MSTDEFIQLHYKKISEKYHSAFFYSGEYESWQINLILKHLDLSENHRLADIGGGTGRFASLIYEKGGLKYPVTCVDPSADMLQRACKLKGVHTICSDAVEFCLGKDDIIYDRILMKEVVHHLTEKELKNTFSALQNKISKNGYLVICTRPHDVEYPFFQEAHAVMQKKVRSKEYYVSLLEKSGFVVSSISVHDYPASLNINWWTTMIRNRFWSIFSRFDDDQLEQGIDEINGKFGKSGFVTFLDKLAVIVVHKK